jgi:hypothetical protein
VPKERSDDQLVANRAFEPIHSLPSWDGGVAAAAAAAAIGGGREGVLGRDGVLGRLGGSLTPAPRPAPLRSVMEKKCRSYFQINVC